MAKRLQLRRGTTAEHSSFTGAVGEPTYDTDKKTIIVHDGATVGGKPMATEDGVVDKTTAQTIAGTKTFSSSPIVPTPTTDMQSTTKKYVDAEIVAETTVTDKKNLDIVKSNRLGSGSTRYLKGKGDVITETSSSFISKVAVDNQYVDMGGTIVDTYGDELVTNGDFSDGTSGWLTAYGSTFLVENGALKVTTGTNAASGYRNLTLIAGNYYKLSIALLTGNIYLGSGVGGNSILNINTAGTYLFKAAATTTISLMVASGSEYFDNISVKEITNIDYSTGNRDDDSSFVPEVTVQDQAVDGLVTTADVYTGDYVVVDREELVTNGTFDSGSTGWVLGNNITYVASAINYNTVEEVVSITQSITGLTVGKTYIVRFEISNYVSGLVFPALGGISALGWTSGNGEYIWESVAATTSEQIIFETSGGSNAVFTIDNISVKQVDEVYQATENTTIGTSLLDAKFRVRDNYGISNQVIACHKQDATTKTYLGIHKEIAFVDFKAGQYRQGMLDNGFSEVESGLYSKGGFNYVFIGVWQTLNKGAHHPDLNFYGTRATYPSTVTTSNWHWSATARPLISVADTFLYATTGVGDGTGVIGGASTRILKAYNGTIYIPTRPNSLYSNIVYPSQFIYAPDYSKLPDELTRKRMEKNLEGADEGVSGLVSIEPNKSSDADGSVGDAIWSDGFTLSKYSHLIGTNVTIYSISDSGVFRVTIAYVLSVETNVLRLKDSIVRSNGTYYIPGQIHHLSQGSHLITDRIGDPANWEQVALDRLAEGKPLIGQNALLVSDTGQNLIPNASHDNETVIEAYWDGIANDYFKVSNKAIELGYSGVFLIKGAWNAYTENGTVGANSMHHYIENNNVVIDLDSTVGSITIAEHNAISGMLNYTANNNPAIKSDPLPMLSVEPKVVMSSSHSLYKGASVGNMNGKIQVSDSARSYESKVLENAEVATATYDVGVGSVVTLGAYQTYKIIDDGFTNVTKGDVVEYVGAGTGVWTVSAMTFDHVASADWNLQSRGFLATTPEHSTTTLSASTSPASKYFTGYAYDENGIEYRTYNLEEMEWDTVIDNADDFTDITETTALDGLFATTPNIHVTNGIFEGYWHITQDIGGLFLSHVSWSEVGDKLIWSNGETYATRWTGLGWGDNNQFNNLTNSTHTDLNGNVMKTSFFSVPTGFKQSKGSN